MSIIPDSTPILPLALLTLFIVAESTRDKNSSFENGPDLPDNFAKVTDGIYRCSFPQEHHLQAIKELRLKTVVLVLFPSTLGFLYS